MIPRGSERQYLLLTASTILVWFTVSLVSLLHFPPWDATGDESLFSALALSIFRGRMGVDYAFGSYLSKTGFGMLSPWLWGVIMGIPLRLFGETLWAARFISTLLATGAMVLVFLTAKEIAGPKAGFLATILTGLAHTFCRWGAHSARAEGAIALFLMLSLWLVVLSMMRKKAWLSAIGGFTATISLLVRPTALFILPTLLIFLLVQKRFRESGFLIIGAILAGIIMLFTNILPYHDMPTAEDIDRINKERFFPLGVIKNPRRLTELPSRLWQCCIFLTGYPDKDTSPGLLGILSLSGAFFKERRAGLWLTVSLALSLAVFIPYLAFSYLCFVVPPLAVFAAGTLSGLKNRHIKWLLGIIIPILLIPWAKWPRDFLWNREKARAWQEVERAIPPGARVVTGVWGLWWPLHKKAVFIWPYDTLYAEGRKSPQDLVRETHGTHLIVPIAERPALPPRGFRKNDDPILRLWNMYYDYPEYVKALPAAAVVREGFILARIVSGPWRVDSLLILEIPEEDRGR
ncbi:MAG: glycosyltransferase family 39 protein [candidate division WOR-3 bacterium]